MGKKKDVEVVIEPTEREKLEDRLEYLEGLVAQFEVEGVTRLSDLQAKIGKIHQALLAL